MPLSAGTHQRLQFNHNKGKGTEMATHTQGFWKTAELEDAALEIGTLTTYLHIEVDFEIVVSFDLDTSGDSNVIGGTFDCMEFSCVDEVNINAIRMVMPEERRLNPEDGFADSKTDKIDITKAFSHEQLNDIVAMLKEGAPHAQYDIDFDLVMA